MSALVTVSPVVLGKPGPGRRSPAGISSRRYHMRCGESRPVNPGHAPLLRSLIRIGTPVKFHLARNWFTM
jgi:hypothetical protein